MPVSPYGVKRECKLFLIKFNGGKKWPILVRLFVDIKKNPALVGRGQQDLAESWGFEPQIGLSPILA